MRPLSALIFLIFSMLPQTSWAFDRLQERAYAEALEQALPREAVWVTAGQQRWFGLFRESARAPRGGVLLLHDRGVHADARAVIGPLRRDLPNFGWHTLAVQLPVAEVDTTLDDWPHWLDEAAPRIKAGIEFLVARGAEQVIVLGHGLGALAAVAYVDGAGDAAGVHALITISLPRYQHPDTRLDPGYALAKLRLPTLDIYGGRDWPEVVTAAPLRLEAAQKAGRAGTAAPLPGQTAKVRETAARKTGNPAYRQIEIGGADHAYDGHVERLQKAVRGWLERATTQSRP